MNKKAVSFLSRLHAATDQLVAVCGEAQADLTRVRDDAFNHGICVGLQMLFSMGATTQWCELIRSVGANEILQFAAHVEPEEWELTGLSQWALPYLKMRKPRKKK